MKAHLPVVWQLLTLLQGGYAGLQCPLCLSIGVVATLVLFDQLVGLLVQGLGRFGSGVAAASTGSMLGESQRGWCVHGCSWAGRGHAIPGELGTLWKRLHASPDQLGALEGLLNTMIAALQL
jgi:hypothetical protein